MSSTSPVRTLPLMLAVVGFAVISAIVVSIPSSADQTAGEFSLELDVVEEQADLDVPFVLRVGIFHSGAAYQAVQWDIVYDSSLVDVDIVNTAPDPSAPFQCISKSDNGLRVLLGCLDFSGPNLTYSGNAWNVSVKCTGVGAAEFKLQGLDVTSFVRTGTGFGIVHIHNDTIICGPRPPSPTPTATQTPLPDTATATPSPTRTPTATRTASPTPTISLPPEQNQFEQLLPIVGPDDANLLGSAEEEVNKKIALGWDVRAVEKRSLAGTDGLVYSFQRSDETRHADVNRDGTIDLLDVDIVMSQYGLPATQRLTHVSVASGTSVGTLPFVHDVDSVLEQRIEDGFDIRGATEIVDSDGHRAIYALRLRDEPPDADLTGDGEVDLLDAMVALELFGTDVLPPSVSPLPPGPDRFKQVVLEQAAGETVETALDTIEQLLNREVAAGWDVVDVTVVTLAEGNQLIALFQRGVRPSIADSNGDGEVDLLDTLILMDLFGLPGIDGYRLFAIDPYALPSEDVLSEMDVRGELLVNSGFDVANVTLLPLLSGERWIIGGQARSIPNLPDLNGDGEIDLLDALISISLFGTSV